MTLEQANKALAMSWGASAFFTMISLLFPGVGIFDVFFSGGLLWTLIDLVVLGGLTVGIFKRSRVCAVLLPVMLVAAAVYQWDAAGWSARFTRAVPMIVLLAIFARGARASFVFHHLSLEQDAGQPD